jgi:hypothetical protein
MDAGGGEFRQSYDHVFPIGRSRSDFFPAGGSRRRGRRRHVSGLAVGPTGAIYAVWRSFRHDAARGDAIVFSSSNNHGESFSRPQRLAAIVPFDSQQFSGNGADACSALFAPCPSGFTFPRYMSIAAVTADEQGVHVIWNARTASGESKIFFVDSRDGVTFSTPSSQIDNVRTGRQWFPDIASAGGIITTVFYDSRLEAGLNSGSILDVWSPQSFDGGRKWTEQRLNSISFNPNWNNDVPPFISEETTSTCRPYKAPCSSNSGSVATLEDWLDPRQPAG